MRARQIPLQGMKPLIRYLSVTHFQKTSDIFLRHLGKSIVDSAFEISISEGMAGELWGLFFQSEPTFEKLFRMASTSDVREFGAIGLFFLISKNYRDIIDSFHLFSQLHRITDPLRYIQNESHFIQQLYIVEQNPFVKKYISVYSASLFYFTVHQLVDAKPLLSHINLPFSDVTQSEIQNLQELFGVPLNFNSEALEMVYKIEIIDLPLRFTDDKLRLLLKDHLHGTGQSPSLSRESDFVLKVKARISIVKSNPDLSADSIARELQLSRRTFDRRLSQLGYSFNSLKDEVYREYALNLLRQGYGAKKISEDLGFANISSFSRAFKRWTNASPRQLKSLLYSSSKDSMVK